MNNSIGQSPSTNGYSPFCNIEQDNFLKTDNKQTKASPNCQKSTPACRQPDSIDMLIINETPNNLLIGNDKQCQTSLNCGIKSDSENSLRSMFKKIFNNKDNNADNKIEATLITQHQQELLHSDVAKVAEELVSKLERPSQIGGIITQAVKYNEIGFYKQFKDCTIEDLTFLLQHAFQQKKGYQQKTPVEKKKINNLSQKFAKELAMGASKALCRHTAQELLDKANADIADLGKKNELSPAENKRLEHAKSFSQAYGAGYKNAGVNTIATNDPKLWIEEYPHSLQKKALEFGVLLRDKNLLTEGMALHKEVKENWNMIYNIMGGMATGVGIAAALPELLLPISSVAIKTAEAISRAGSNELSTQENTAKIITIGVEEVILSKLEKLNPLDKIPIENKEELKAILMPALSEIVQKYIPDGYHSDEIIEQTLGDLLNALEAKKAQVGYGDIV